MPNLASVLKYFPTPFENTLVMTLNGTIAPGATTVAINNLGNYSNGQVVVFIVDAGTTAKQVFTGTVSGSSVVNVVWTYGTNVSHADGAAIADYVTATDFGMMSKGIQVQHKQDGTHGDVTSTSWVNAGALTQTGPMALNGSWDGWVGANESWTFASSTTITVPTDATTKYDVGDYVKITQSATVKYFVIASLTATVLTVAGLNGATVANSAITANAYSKARLPHGVGLNGGLPYNPYKFSVYRSAAWTTNNGTFGTVLFDTKLYDTGTNVDVATNKGRFTAPIAGFYHFSAGVRQTNTGGGAGIQIALNKNSGAVKYGTSTVTGAATYDAGAQVSGQLQLAANDYIEVGFVGTGGTGATGSGFSYFDGFLVSAL